MTAPFTAAQLQGGAVGGQPRVPAALVSDNPAFRTPSLTAENGYVDNPALDYAPTLRVSSSDATPDARRIGQAPFADYRAPANRPPAEYWDGPNGPGHDDNVRHRDAEKVDPAPEHMYRGTHYASAKRAAPDQRRTPPPETRVTSDLMPSTYQFERPFDQHAPHQLNGVRFSMADHKRAYPDQMNGMLPQMTRRNTYRQDPGPWDAAMTDYPVNTPADWGGYRTAAIPMTNTRSNRLDAY